MNKEPELVDLGLPSGNLWMKCNLGAKTEIGSGLYYQFGSSIWFYGYEEAREHSTWKTCPFNNGGEYFDEEYFKVNRSKWFYKNRLLKPEYDIVTKTYGENFKIPTDIDFQELLDNTTQEVVFKYNDSDVNGVLFTSIINSKTLFIPYSGDILNGIYRIGNWSSLWTSRLNSSILYSAHYFYCDSDVIGLSNSSRISSYTIRGIKVRNE